MKGDSQSHKRKNKYAETKISSRTKWSMSPQMSHVEESDIEKIIYKKHNPKSNKSGYSAVEKYHNDYNKVQWGKPEHNIKHEEEKPKVPKEGPNFELSGKLTEETNKLKGVVIKYNEPSEARIPKIRWRLYPFKSGQSIGSILYLHRQSAYMIGRDRRISEIPVDHPSCSKQHAVLQFRAVMPQGQEKNEITVDFDPTTVITDASALEPKPKPKAQIKPYIIDLASANGTYLNNKLIEAQRYYELMEGDVLKFGYSTREYVLLHENSDSALASEAHSPLPNSPNENDQT